MARVVENPAGMQLERVVVYIHFIQLFSNVTHIHHLPPLEYKGEGVPERRKAGN